MTEFAADRAKVRRRKLPRLPRFTWYQKLWIAIFSSAIVYYVGAGIREPSDLALLSCSVAGLHWVFLDALRPPHGERQSFLLYGGLWLLGLSLTIMGL